jgi:hypothetical protein
MTTVTAYKVLEQRGIKYLQYLKLYKFWFIKWYEWETIPYPNIKGLPNIVCDKIPKYKNLKKFCIEYSNIDNYFNGEYLQRKAKFKKDNNK